MKLLGAIAFSVAVMGTAHSAVVTESGDAGDTLATAQRLTSDPQVAITAISGSLSSTSDVDYFRFSLAEVGSLRISFDSFAPAGGFPTFVGMAAYFANGDLLMATSLDVGGLFGDTSYGTIGGISYQFGNANLEAYGLPVGEYVLRVDGSGQINFGRPRYEGGYTINVSGRAETLGAAVPEPSTLALIGAAALGLGWQARRRKA